MFISTSELRFIYKLFSLYPPKHICLILHSPIMKYTFNGKRVSQYMADNHLSLNRVMKDTKKTNNVTVAKWRDGEVMRGEDILVFCNVYDVNPAEFFLEYEQPLLDEGKRKPHERESDKQKLDNALLQQQMTFITERAELEKSHLRELMQKDIDLARREADLRDTIRREMREEYEEQIQSLRSQLIDLTAQYRELELMTGTRRVSAVAECTGSTYGAQNK